MSKLLVRAFAGWRTGLSGPVVVLQAGNAANYFGSGLILPFGIIYLHEARGFPTATAGLVLAALMGTAAVVTLPSGVLVDRFRAKSIVIAGISRARSATRAWHSSTVPGKRSSAQPSAAPDSESQEPRTEF